ncbi:hypothetical protein EU545_04285 [Candidatus Thorarchaeota archaeon]|nr:MAG: hypothetical protein EU545_04285 [Candidatus Thorarchaeota archaeon]
MDRQPRESKVPILRRKILVIGHRGAAAYAPENTLLSFQTAIEMGADMVELDVRETADGELVCIHDRDLTRLCECDGLISEMDFDEIAAFDLGSGQHVPLLRDVLSHVRGKAGVNVEIKVPGIESRLAHIIDDLKMSSEVVVSSFIHETLLRFREMDRRTRTGMLFKEPMDDVLSYVRDMDVASLHPLFFIIDEDFVEKAHNADLLVYPWTVNDKDMMLELLGIGVDGIITDYPDIAVEVRRHFKLRKE